MHLDFDDELGVNLPFVRHNPDIEILEMDSNGDIIDVVEASLDDLNALGDYYLMPVVDPELDNIHFEMDELDTNELGQFKFGGRISTKGTAKVTAPKLQVKAPRISVSGQAAIKAAQEAARRARAVVRGPRKPVIRPARRKTVRPRKRTVPKVIRAVEAIKVARPSQPVRVIAKPRLADAGVTCGCAQLARIEKLLSTAQTQRLATSEHNTLIRRNKFRRETLKRLKKIIDAYPGDRSDIIKAACGMG